MERHTRTTRHLADRRFRDPDTGPRLSPSQAGDPRLIARLSWRALPKGDISWEHIAEGIRETGVVVFADTSLFDDATPASFWDALDSPTRLVLTDAVRRELQPWIERRPEHPAMALLRHTLDEPQDALVAQLRTSPPFAYYFTLLALRRGTFDFYGRALAGELGRDPSEDEVRRRVQQAVGERGLLLGKKGLTPGPGLPPGADDEVVTLAVLYAVTTGQPTLMLTKDEDLQEQFYKLIWLLDTHYRAMLFAGFYAASPTSFEHVGRAPDSRWVTDRFESLCLVRKPVALDWRVLPPTYHFVPITCLVVGLTLTELTFGAETEMARVFGMKLTTGGLNTDTLGGVNLHYWLAPLPLPMGLHDCVGLALDRRSPALKDTDVRIPWFDIDQALFVGERHSWT